MEMTYEILKQKVAKVEVIKEINMGPWDVMFDEKTEVPNICTINDQDEIIIPIGTQAKFSTIPRAWFDMEFEDGKGFDVCFEYDEELNEHLKLIEFIGSNERFV